MLKTHAFERNIESGNGIRELLILNPDLTELFLRGMESFRALDKGEKFRFGMLLRNMFSSTQGAYIRQLSVRYDPEDAEGIGSVLDSLLINPGAQEWLERNTPDWRPEFRAYVEERLASIKRRADNPPAE